MARAPALLAFLLLCVAAPVRAGVDGVWSPLTGPFDPFPRADHAAFFDAPANRMVVVGPERFEELWALSFDGGAPHWIREPVPPPYPAGRLFPAYAFDAARRRALLVAGSGVVNTSVWALELAPAPHWVQIPTRGGVPLERVSATAIFDPLRDRLVLYGGAQWFQYPFDEAWALSFADSSWSAIPYGTPKPLPRHSHAAAYDPLHDRMIVHGGFSTQFNYTGQMPRDTTWALDFAGAPHWEMLDSAIARPPVRSRHTLVVDEARRLLVLHGGASPAYPYTPTPDTWTLGLDPGATWTHLSDGGPAAERNSAAVIPPRGTIVYFGGYPWPNDLDLRELDPAVPRWTSIVPPEPALRPPRTADSWVMLDPARDRMLAWGSYLDWLADTLWSYDLGGAAGWHAEPVAGLPSIDPGSYLSSVLVDPVRDRLLLLGGGWAIHFGSRLDQMWEIPLAPAPAWNRLFPADTLPVGRRDYSVVFDPAGDRVLVFGGATRQGPSDDLGLARDDLYALELSPAPRWRRLYPANSPGPRDEHQAFLDGRGRMVVFGGWYSQGSRAPRPLRLDVWVLDLATLAWSRIGPDAPGPGRIAYDSSRDRIVLTRDSSGETWALPLDGSGAWTRLETPWPWPTPRALSALLYDAPRDRVMLFGGIVPDVYPEPFFVNAELWSLAFDAPTPALVSLVAARAFADRVEVEWATTLAGPIEVQRRVADGAWATRATLLPDGGRRVAFVDGEVAPGARYGYRLRWHAGAAERVAGEAWVEIPAAAFALYGAAPNPSPGGLTVRFALPDGSPATIEVLDIAGRRVLAQRLAAPAPGAQVLRLDERGALAPGVYLVRLTQGARVATARAVVLL